jgi:hypothetical protein
VAFFIPNTMTFIHKFNPFRKPTANELVEASLEDYERLLLINEANAAYATKMAEYYSEGIARLSSRSKGE